MRDATEQASGCPRPSAAAPAGLRRHAPPPGGAPRRSRRDSRQDVLREAHRAGHRRPPDLLRARSRGHVVRGRHPRPAAGDRHGADGDPRAAPRPPPRRWRPDLHGAARRDPCRAADRRVAAGRRRPGTGSPPSLVPAADGASPGPVRAHAGHRTDPDGVDPPRSSTSRWSPKGFTAGERVTRPGERHGAKASAYWSSQTGGQVKFAVKQVLKRPHTSAFPCGTDRAHRDMWTEAASKLPRRSGLTTTCCLVAPRGAYTPRL